MSILKVARMGHPVLRKPARALDRAEIASPRIQQLIDDMIATMREYEGIGLAAPQVHEGFRVFVAGVPGADDPMPLMVLINPEVEPIGAEVVEDWEGCLSIPDVRGRVPRSSEVSVRALDRRGAAVRMTAQGLAARVIQHETDHLDGILFLDRMTSLESLSYIEEFERFGRRESDAMDGLS